jgi:hypothetical protein
MLKDLQSQLLALPDDVTASPARLFSSVLDFYEHTRIADTALDSDGDMLLFQWGTYDWGQGLRFELDLTRQAIPAEEEDPPIFQLHCTYYYDPSKFQDIIAGDRWCHRPAQLKEFRRFVLDAEPLRRAQRHSQLALEIWLDDAE